MGRIIISPAEYSAWHQRTGVKIKQYPVISAIHESLLEGKRASNQSIAEKMGITPVRAGQITKDLSALGVIEDASLHPLRRDWRLSEEGSNLAQFIKERKTHE